MHEKRDWMQPAGLALLLALVMGWWWLSAKPNEHQCECNHAEKPPGLFVQACPCKPVKGCECEPGDIDALHKLRSRDNKVAAAVYKEFYGVVDDVAALKAELAKEREWRRKVDVLKRGDDGIWFVWWEEKP